MNEERVEILEKSNKDFQSKKISTDWGVTIPVVIMIVGFCSFLVLFPEKANQFLSLIFDVVTGCFGWLYELIVIVFAIICIWFIFGPLGKKRLGHGKQMSTFAWWGMLFGGACSSSILYWATMEYIYYIQSPPFGVEPYTVEAFRWASAYGPFHWGFMPFMMYAMMTVVIGFYIHVRKPTNALRISDACISVIGEKKANGFVGKVIDCFYILPNMLLHGGVSLGLSTPLVGALVEEVFGIEHSLAVDAGLLISWTILFTISVYAGLTKGMKFITNLKMWLIIGLLVYIFICGPTSFIMNNTLESLGVQLQNIIQMTTYTSAVDDGSFAQDWTIFYFAWFFATILGTCMYYAKVCRGRTVRETVIGVTLSNAVFCMIFFWVIGNYSMDLYLKDVLPIEEMMTNDMYGTAVAIWGQLPMSPIVIIAFLIYAFIATWGVIQGAAYTGAMAGTKNLGEDDEPPRTAKVFWSILLGALALSLLFLGGLETVKSSAMLAAIPTTIITGILLVALGKDMYRIWGPGNRKKE
ncbi:BCCT family transporter [Eubacterium callanderi]|uniref:BCCT family transporter n=1 Tax=Eubacterium callanderi TaxID=53442 RepID=UPI001C2D52CC|nr:BCCT family transporter [Eubacterium callanderi]MBV1684110.1 BCCT family transporter [Eubacterium callanderi]